MQISAQGYINFIGDALFVRNSFINATNSRDWKWKVYGTADEWCCTTRRVTLIIENTLSLAADQQSKYPRATQNHGPILPYQIDSLSDKADVTKLEKCY